MKKAILLFWLPWLSLTAVADTPVCNLILSLKDGNEVEFALSDHPKITFSETEIWITCKGIEVSFDLDNFNYYWFYPTPNTGIIDLPSDESLFSLEGESLLFPSLKANSTVTIYSTNGQLVFQKTVLQDGEYAFPISALQTGIYLINVNGSTYKFMKR